MNPVVLSFRPRVVSQFIRRRGATWLVTGVMLAGVPGGAGAEVVISQVYGGGGNSGAVYRNDFVELFNRGTNAVQLDGWSVQYASAAGTSWQVAALGGQIAPGQYFLLQLGSGGANGLLLPAADATNTVNFSASAGKVALVEATIPVSGTCPAGGAIADLVGYGTTASCYEGTNTAPAGSATMASFRAGNGCMDSDNNRADFFTSTPAPRNRTAPAAPCAGASVPRPLHELQGDGAVSPLIGRTVTTTTNIVTALRNTGYFLQASDAEADANASTSEAIFVETPGGLPTEAVVGNALVVTGFVEEFAPASDPSAPPRTQLINATVTLVATGVPLPGAALVSLPDLAPTGPLDQLERFESMRVRVDSLTVVGATEGFLQEPGAFGISDGLFHGVMTGWPRPMREPGVPASEPLPAGAPPGVPRFDGNPERLRVDSNAQPGAPRIEVTAGTIVEGLTGVLDFEQRAWTLLPDASSGHGIRSNAMFHAPPPTGADEWMVASLNLQRFFDTEDDPAVDEAVLTAGAFQGRLNKASLTILDRLGAPDILGVVEMENLATLQTLATRLNTDSLAAGRSNITYAAWLEEGTDIGGIDSGFLVNTTRVQVVDVIQIGRDTTYTNPITGLPQLLHDRPPLFLRAWVPGTTAGETFPVTVLLNHLRSMSGIDEPSDGARVRAKRRAQAEHVARLVQERQSLNPPENLILIGDFNAFPFNDGYVDVVGTIRGAPAPADEVTLASPDLVEPDLVLLTDRLPATERYSYVFDGNAQAIDHILVSQSLCARVTRHGYVRGNADAPESFRGNFNRPERLSDHDAAVAWFATSTTPRVISLTVGAGGELELFVSATPNRALHVEASTNLVEWDEIGTVTVDDCGRGRFVTPAGIKGSARFFRIKE